MALVTAWVLATHAINGKRTAFVPINETTHASVLGVAWKKEIANQTKRSLAGEIEMETKLSSKVFEATEAALEQAH